MGYPQYNVVVTNPSSSTQDVIQPTGAAIIPLTLKGATSQSADLTEWQNSSGSVLAAITAAGVFTGTSSGSSSADVTLTPATSARNVVQPTADVVPITSKGKAGQTADLFQFQNSTGAVLAQIASDGTFKNSSGNVVIGSQRIELNGTSARLLLQEVAAAPSGTLNEATLYAIDNGAGKTQLTVVFGTGAAVVIATEP